MKFDLVIRNGNLVFSDEIIPGAIGVVDGRIAAIAERTLQAESLKEIDAQGAYVLPGLVDGNIHMRTPGQEHKEDYQTGTSAAAAGGVTTIIDMPNTNPSTTTVERMNEKRKLVEGKAFVDYAFHFSGGKDNFEELEKVENIASVKFFMAGHETTPTTVSDLGILLKSFSILAGRGIPVTVHAENQMLINALSAKYSARSDFKAYSDSRNDTVCEVAVQEIICLAKETGVHVHLCHLSSRKELLAVKRAREDGVNITIEVVPYHLFFSYDDCERLGSFSKVSPALKSPGDCEALWEGIKNGLVDCLASEHTPHTLEEKNNTVWRAPAGMPGVQEMLPLMVNHGTPLTTIARLGAENPARIFGLKTKGKIGIGYDADLVILNTEKEWTVKREDLKSKCGWSAYEGRTLKGVPRMTLVRGNVVCEDWEVNKKS
jgi:dihydroorotase (multifunctional complex type)